MATYLVDLTIQLAAGVERLPEAIRQRHLAFLLGCQNEDGGFSGREGESDLYYTGFALRSLAILGGLHGEVAERAARFLTGRLTGRAAVVDLLSLVYGAMLLESAAGVNVFADARPGWRKELANALERFRRDDGGYAKGEEGHAGSTYYTFLVVLCRQLVDLPIIDPQGIVNFVHARRRDDGGFVEIAPMKRSGTNPTAAAVALLRILDSVTDDTREGVIDFVSEMQTDEGGLRANTRIPIPDLLSSFTGLLTLADLGGLDAVDLTAIRQFARQLALPEGGFHGALWDTGCDVEYTFYGLGTLALLSDNGDGRHAPPT